MHVIIKDEGLEGEYETVEKESAILKMGQ